MQADDGRACGRDRFFQFREFRRRHAELGMRAGRANLVVMPMGVPGVEPQQDFAAAKLIAPGSQYIEVVDRDSQPLFQCPTVLAPRREIGREEQPFQGNARNGPKDLFDLRAGNAFEPESRRRNRAQNPRIRIGLERIEHAGDRWHREHCTGLHRDDFQVVDIGAVTITEQGE